MKFMAKKVIAKIHGVAESPCVRTSKTDHVLKVEIGGYLFPLHITELWKEVRNADNSSSGGEATDKSKPSVQAG